MAVKSADFTVKTIVITVKSADFTVKTIVIMTIDTLKTV